LWPTTEDYLEINWRKQKSAYQARVDKGVDGLLCEYGTLLVNVVLSFPTANSKERVLHEHFIKCRFIWLSMRLQAPWIMMPRNA
jgi:hypothetical protein